MTLAIHARYSKFGDLSNLKLAFQIIYFLLWILPFHGQKTTMFCPQMLTPASHVGQRSKGTADNHIERFRGMICLDSVIDDSNVFK